MRTAGDSFGAPRLPKASSSGGSLTEINITEKPPAGPEVLIICADCCNAPDIWTCRLTAEHFLADIIVYIMSKRMVYIKLKPDMPRPKSRRCGEAKATLIGRIFGLTLPWRGCCHGMPQQKCSSVSAAGKPSTSTRRTAVPGMPVLRTTASSLPFRDVKLPEV